MLIRLGCALACAGVLAACVATAAEKPVNSMQLKLMPEQSATIAPGVTLRYERAEDSTISR
jgi:hypothetical protein